MVHAGRRPSHLRDHRLHAEHAAGGVQAEASRKASSKTSSSTRPEGLSVNPEATPVKCTVAQLSATPPACPPTSLVGINYFTVSASADGPELRTSRRAACRRGPRCRSTTSCRSKGCRRWSGSRPTRRANRPSSSARSTRSTSTSPSRSATSTRRTATGHPPIVGSRLVFFGGKGRTRTRRQRHLSDDAEQLRGPARPRCSTSTRTAASTDEDEASFTTAVGASGCDKVPFKPTIAVSTQGGSVDSPEPTTVDLGIPFDPDGTDRQLVPENGQGRRCRKGWASTPPRPTAS